MTGVDGLGGENEYSNEVNWGMHGNKVGGGGGLVLLLMMGYHAGER